MLIQALATARDLGRLHEVGTVLVRHGMGDVVQRLGIAGFLERAGRALHIRGAEGLATKPPQVRVREAMESLGPAFVKVGQILAGRPDLLPPEWIRELSALQERARPVPWEEIRAQLVEDLGAPPEEVFDGLDPAPLAAASIAQVHRARLRSGREVVLKVRRPGIDEDVEADLRLIARLAEVAEREMPELRRYRPRRLARTFARTLRDELDMRVEARNAARLRRELAGHEDLVVPGVHDRYTGERLLVLDLLRGRSLGSWLRAGRPGNLDPRGLARIGADACLRMVLVDGFFHADPHPGNVLLLDDGRLGLVDFGMVGHLGDERRIEFLRILNAVVERRPEDAVDVLLGWSMGHGVEPEELTQDVMSFVDRYHGVSLERVDVTEMLLDVAALLRENDLALPPDVALLLKVLVTLDSLGRELDPQFVMAERMEPFVRQAWERESSPTRVLRRGVGKVAPLLASLPHDIGRLAARLRRGRVHLHVDVEQLDRFGRHIDRSANRLTVGMVTSSLIVGTSIALRVSIGPDVMGIPLLGLLMFGGSIVLGVALLWSILRSTRD